MRDPLSRPEDRPALIRIVAIGSPLGDDAVGLVAGRRLQQSPPRYCDVRVRDRPGIGLIDDFRGMHAVLVLDAVRLAAPPGTIVSFDLRNLEPGAPAGATSSHGFALRESLALARTLGHLPERADLLGVVIGAGDLVPGRLSDAVRGAVDEVDARARAWVETVRAATSSFP